jgi:putative phosphoribosyl transferase
MFRDREQAGEVLASALKDLRGEDVLVLAIPRGGVVVGSIVARALGAPLDIIVTKKIGAPGEAEYALGAVTQDGEVILDEAAVRMLGVGRDYLDSEAANQREEVRDRMKRFRGERPYPSLKGKTVVIVDDGIATGYTALAAARSVKRQGPKSVVLAVPVGPSETIAKLSREVDKVVCLEMPEPFFAIGEFYSEFGQVEDDEVRRILGAHRTE